jgi:hypothetical protein
MEQRIDKCPTCGAVVVVQTSDDGTSFYVPVVLEALTPADLEDLRRQFAQFRFERER